MITVQVKLFASLRRLFPQLEIGQPLTVELPAPATLDRLLRRLNLPETKIIFVNGIAQTDDQHPLHQGDEIAVFPLVGGG